MLNRSPACTIHTLLPAILTTVYTTVLPSTLPTVSTTVLSFSFTAVIRTCPNGQLIPGQRREAWRPIGDETRGRREQGGAPWGHAESAGSLHIDGDGAQLSGLEPQRSAAATALVEQDFLQVPWKENGCQQFQIKSFAVPLLSNSFLTLLHPANYNNFTCYLLYLYHVHKTDNTVHSTYTTTSNTKQQLTIKFHSAQILEILDQ